jgi:hypothetical protein
VWQEVLMVSSLLAMAVPLFLRRGTRDGLLGLLAALVDRWAEVALERERGKNLRATLDRLPAGGVIMERRSDRLQTIKVFAQGDVDRGGAP